MVRSGKCLLNDLHTGRCGEARVKREKKEYRHSFSPYTFCSCSSEMQRRLPVSRGHKSPRRNQGIRWLKEEDWESWSQVLWISQCGKKKKSWAVSLGWKRLKTENRTMGQKAPGAYPQGAVLALRSLWRKPGAAATFIHPLLPGHTLHKCQKLSASPYTADRCCRQSMTLIQPWSSPPSQIRLTQSFSGLCLGGAWVYSGWCWAQDSFGPRSRASSPEHLALLCSMLQVSPWVLSDTPQIYSGQLQKFIRTWGWRQSWRIQPLAGHTSLQPTWQKMLQLLFTFFQGQEAHYLSRKLM